MSEQRACRVLAQPRRTQRYVARRCDVTALRLQMRALAYNTPRAGYRHVWDLLRLSFAGLGLRRVYRLYRLEGLTIQRRRVKRARRGQRAVMPEATAPNQRWSINFIHDQLLDRRCFVALNIIDDFTREAIAIELDTSLSGRRVARVLDALGNARGLPKVAVRLPARRCKFGPCTMTYASILRRQDVLPKWPS